MTLPTTYTVYSKSGCGHCEKVKSLLTLSGIRFIELKLNRDYDKSQFVSRFGDGSTFPQVLDEQGNQLGGAASTARHLRETNL